MVVGTLFMNLRNLEFTEIILGFQLFGIFHHQEQSQEGQVLIRQVHRYASLPLIVVECNSDCSGGQSQYSHYHSPLFECAVNPSFLPSALLSIEPCSCAII